MRIRTPSDSPSIIADTRVASSSGNSGDASGRWIKIDFHLHANEDPLDELDHSATELVHRAHDLGFGALAITLHDHVFTKSEVFDTARELDILLIPAAELRLEGADVIIVNITEEEAAKLHKLRDLEKLREKRGRSMLTFAPHPFYVFGGSIGRRRLLENIDLFDAIEWSHFYTRWINPNRPAAAIARKYGKPLLATSDAHRLDFFGHDYTLARIPESDGAPTPELIFDAIRAGDVRPVTQPWSFLTFLHYAWWIFTEHELRVLHAHAAGSGQRFSKK